MMRSSIRSLLLAAPLLFGMESASPAQQPPPPSTDWSVEEVTVTAQSSGPAYWHAQKGAAEVWILGVVEALPKGYAWNQTHLGKLLDGTRLVLLPPRATASLFDAGWFLLTKRSTLYLPDGQTLDGVLGAPLPRVSPRRAPSPIAMRIAMPTMRCRWPRSSSKAIS